MTDWKPLEKQLRAKFRDPSLLQQALVHRSYLNEVPDSGLDSNERLEFLGDAVLGLVVAGKLYADYPDRGEGGFDLGLLQRRRRLGHGRP